MEIKRSDICQYQAPTKVQELPVEVLLHCLEWSTPADAASCMCSGDRWGLSTHAASDDLWEVFLRRDFPGRRGRPPGTNGHRRREVYAIIATGKWREVTFGDRPIYQRGLIVVGCAILSIPLTIYLSPRILRAFHSSCIVPALDAWEDAADAINPPGKRALGTFNYASSSWLAKNRRNSSRSTSHGKRKPFNARPLYQRILISLVSLLATPVWLVRHRRAIFVGLRTAICFLSRKLQEANRWADRSIITPLRSLASRFLLRPLYLLLVWTAVKFKQGTIVADDWLRRSAKFTAKAFIMWVFDPTVRFAKFSLWCLDVAARWSKRNLVEPAILFCCSVAKKTNELISRAGGLLYNYILHPAGSLAQWTAKQCISSVCTTSRLLSDYIVQPTISFAKRSVTKLSLIARRSALWVVDYLFTPVCQGLRWLCRRLVALASTLLNLTHKYVMRPIAQLLHSMIGAGWSYILRPIMFDFLPWVFTTVYSILERTWRFLCDTARLMYRAFRILASYFVSKCVLPVFAVMRKVLNVVVWTLSLGVHFVTGRVYPVLRKAFLVGVSLLHSLALTLRDGGWIIAETFYRYILCPLGALLLLCVGAVKLTLEVVVVAVLEGIHLVLSLLGQGAKGLYDQVLTPIGHFSRMCFHQLRDATLVALNDLRSILVACLLAMASARKTLVTELHAAFIAMRDGILSLIQIISAQWVKFAAWTGFA